LIDRLNTFSAGLLIVVSYCTQFHMGGNLVVSGTIDFLVLVVIFTNIFWSNKTRIRYVDLVNSVVGSSAVHVAERNFANFIECDIISCLLSADKSVHL